MVYLQGQLVWLCFNGTSTKTRIETKKTILQCSKKAAVLMEHPPKQGLKPFPSQSFVASNTSGF